MNARKIAIVCALFSLVAANLACGFSSTSQPTAVPTLPPPPADTNTPLPTVTNTPRPTATNTLIPTATPDRKATQAAELETAIRSQLAELKLPADSGHIAWMQDEAISIPLQGAVYDWRSFDDNFSVGDFVMYTEATWKTDSWPTCGILFRSNDKFYDGNTYALQFLRFSGLPAWDIEYFKDGYYVTTITTDIKFSDYLDIADGAMNKIVLAAIGNQFKVYVNGNFEGQYYDWSKLLSEGNIGFLATQNAGNTKCIYENSWIWEYSKFRVE